MNDAKKARAIYTVPRFCDGSKSNQIECGNKRLRKQKILRSISFDFDPILRISVYK